MSDTMVKLNTILPDKELSASAETAEQAEGMLVERGFLKTIIWGWLNPAEIRWLEAKFKEHHITTPIDEITEVPGYSRAAVKKGETHEVTVVQPFILEFSRLKSEGKFNERRWHQEGMV